MTSPFLNSFYKNKINSKAEKLYDFRNLLGVLYLLSKNSSSEKALAIFRLNDISCKENLTKSEIYNIFNKMMVSIKYYSEIFSNLKTK